MVSWPRTKIAIVVISFIVGRVAVDLAAAVEHASLSSDKIVDQKQFF
jgi:hypothetical protein